MSIIVVDGPEKAGKSTLIEAIVRRLSSPGRRVSVTHWRGRAKPDDRIYAHSLQVSAVTSAGPSTAVWDRSWASEFVYGTLLRQDRRLAADPWLGEWLHGRAVQANGLRVMLLGPDPGELRARRDSTDLPVRPADEQRLYRQYARRFGWFVPEQFQPDGSRKSADDVAEQVVRAHTEALAHFMPVPPVYCGPQYADIVVVGEARSGVQSVGQWLPFSSRLTTLFGRMFGDRAFNIGWTNAGDCPPEALRSTRVILACGVKATRWLEKTSAERGGMARVVSIPHPAHALRYNNAVTAAERATVQQTIRQLVKEM